MIRLYNLTAELNFTFKNAVNLYLIFTYYLVTFESILFQKIKKISKYIFKFSINICDLSPVTYYQASYLIRLSD